MRDNETIKTNLYVLLAVLVVLAAGLTAALTLDHGNVRENGRARYEVTDSEGSVDNSDDAQALETGAIRQPQKSEPNVSAQTQAGIMAQREEQTPQEPAKDTTTYALRTRDGYLQVYILETDEFYMETSIVYRLLPESVQAQIDAGKEFESEEELFEFLENYSS